MSDVQFARVNGSVPTAAAESTEPDNNPEMKPHEVSVVAAQPPNEKVAVLTSDSEELETGRQRQLPSFEITAVVDAARKASVEKKLRDAFGEDAEMFSVEKMTSAESRSDRLDEAAEMVNTAASIVEDLQMEMQEWSDSIPQNLQNGQKASQVQEAVDELQAVLDQLQSLDFGSIYFPGMMG